MSTQPALPAQWQVKVAGLLTAGLLLCGAASASPDRVVRHFKVDAHPVITLHNPSGIVTVRAWTKSEVMVTATRASKQVQAIAEQTGNRVDIMTDRASDTVSPEDLRVDYEINVPEDAELQIHDDSGGVTVNNVLGDMNVETVGAGVDLADAAGYLTVKTVGGSFQCVRCAGRLEVSSISGNFRLIDLRSYHVRAQTSTGNILFNGEFLPNGMYLLKNYSGVIDVQFSPGDSFDLSATSLKGKVNNEAKLTPPAHREHSGSRYGNSLFGTFNDGRAKVELTSFDGTINIRKRE
ncbi:MAG TPA: DUF4097 family beta strand repeat-containing protein [Candidatus Polarisedimenticolia bacterium]|jgi:DUF4097 and DUF4098 domain-containing protein YvlB|nr:DUF4097 family beta strand repeat-containing protein [Candidatus Polarisedimenticolia bacterium]